MQVIAEETETDPKLSSTATITISVIDANDNRPTFEEESYSASVSGKFKFQSVWVHFKKHLIFLLINRKYLGLSFFRTSIPGKAIFVDICTNICITLSAVQWLYLFPPVLRHIPFGWFTHLSGVLDSLHNSLFSYLINTSISLFAPKTALGLTLLMRATTKWNGSIAFFLFVPTWGWKT